jgi:uncharacterized tellurite resistance protein B-like protein
MYRTAMDTMDRILPLCDLLLGAAFADGRLENVEQETVRDTLKDLMNADELPEEVEAWINGFDPETFDLADSAGAFKADSVDDRKKVLYLVEAIHEADDELDHAEDAYLQALATALDFPADQLKGLTGHFELDELRQDFQQVRKAPPPIPKK